MHILDLPTCVVVHDKNAETECFTIKILYQSSATYHFTVPIGQQIIRVQYFLDFWHTRGSVVKFKSRGKTNGRNLEPELQSQSDPAKDMHVSAIGGFILCVNFDL